MGPRVFPSPRGVPRGREPLKLLDVTEFYSPTGGGVRTYLENKMRWLAANADVEHVVAVPGSRDGQQPAVGGQWHFMAGLPAPSSPGYHLLTSVRRLRDIIGAERPDVIELGSHLLAPWVLRRALRGLNIPVVGFLHTDVRGYYIEHGLRGALGEGRRAAEHALRWYMRKALGICEVVIAPSEYGRGILEWAGITSTAVVPHGIEMRERRAEKSRSVPGAPIVLYAGRLSREKGLDTVLRALPALCRQSGARVVMVGDGHMRAELEAYAASHPTLLTVLPYERDRARMNQLYAAADVFLAPCPYETFGLAAVEAMAIGTPVVGADGGAIGELIRQTGCGISYEPRNPRALADAVSEGALRSDELGTLARDAVAQRCALDKTMPKLVEVYRENALT